VKRGFAALAAAGLVVAFVLARVSHPGKAAATSSAGGASTPAPQVITPSSTEVPQVQTSVS
jgi:hypothetical protein